MRRCACGDTEGHKGQTGVRRKGKGSITRHMCGISKRCKCQWKLSNRELAVSNATQGPNMFLFFIFSGKQHTPRFKYEAVPVPAGPLHSGSNLAPVKRVFEWWNSNRKYYIEWIIVRAKTHHGFNSVLDRKWLTIKYATLNKWTTNYRKFRK